MFLSGPNAGRYQSEKQLLKATLKKKHRRKPGSFDSLKKNSCNMIDTVFIQVAYLLQMHSTCSFPYGCLLFIKVIFAGIQSG